MKYRIRQYPPLLVYFDRGVLGIERETVLYHVEDDELPENGPPDETRFADAIDCYGLEWSEQTFKLLNNRVFVRFNGKWRPPFQIEFGKAEQKFLDRVAVVLDTVIESREFAVVGYIFPTTPDRRLERFIF